jgi:hypothetical protein
MLDYLWTATSGATAGAASEFSDGFRILFGLAAGVGSDVVARSEVWDEYYRRGDQKAAEALMADVSEALRGGAVLSFQLPWIPYVLRGSPWERVVVIDSGEFFRVVYDGEVGVTVRLAKLPSVAPSGGRSLHA